MIDKSDAFLIGFLVLIGIIMGVIYWNEHRENKKKEDMYQKARISGICPDYWENVNSEDQDEIKCRNTHKMGRCNISGSGIKDFGKPPYFNGRNPEDGDMAKCNWSKYCNVSWEGIDHLCSDMN